MMTLSLVSDEPNLIPADRPDRHYAEQQLLGCCLSGYRQIDELGIRGSDFDSPGHELIWNAICAVAAKGDRPSLQSVRFALQTAAGRDQLDPLILADLSIGASPATDAPTWARHVTGFAQLRGLDHIGVQLRMLAQTDDPDAAWHQARALVDKAPNRTVTPGRSWAEIVGTVIDQVETGQQQGESTPWSDLNRMTYGLVPGRVYLVGARPGEGKSLFAQNCSTAIARRGGDVLYASLEMSEVDLGLRMLADASRVSLSVLQDPKKMNPAAWQDVAAGQARLSAMDQHLTILDDGDLTVPAIASAARDLHRRGNLKLVVVDYVQLMTATNPRDSREQQIALMSRQLKKLARALGVAIIVLSQFNRDSLKRPDHRPSLGDFRESGALEQDADVAILLALDKESAELAMILGKNRHGPMGQINLQMVGAYARIVQVLD